MRSKAFVVGIGGSLLLALAAGCSSEQGAEQKQAAPQATVTQDAAPQPEAAGQQFPLTGTVTETFDSGGYTYLLLKAGGRDSWVATAQTGVQPGDEVTVESGQLMQNFHSRTLDRNFEEIIFTTGLSGGSGPAAASQEAAGGSFSEALQKENGQQGPAGTEDVAAMMGSTKAIVPAAEIEVEKAAGGNGYRVGELYEQAAQLDGKEVQVRGKVVKVSPNIMGRNWIHLQDGTGDAQQNTHDLVVTSPAAQPEKGEVVTVKGVLHANKDFGSGYKYAAIVEDAEVVKP